MVNSFRLWLSAALFSAMFASALHASVNVTSLGAAAHTAATPEPHSGLILLLGSLLLGGLGCITQAGPEASGRAKRTDGEQLTTPE